MAIIFGKETDTGCCNSKCLPIAPQYEEVCPRDPCSPCEEQKCPPKTCASDTIVILPDEVERCFTLRQMGCNGRPIPAIRTCVRMDIRRKGFCRVLLKTTPYKATNENGICFSWGNAFKSLPAGYYEGDIYVNDCCSAHVLLYIPSCNIGVSGSEPVIDEGCGGTISDNECCNVPQVDEELIGLQGSDCNTGCSKC